MNYVPAHQHVRLDDGRGPASGQESAGQVALNGETVDAIIKMICEVVVEERIVNQRLTGAPIEPRAGTAWWTDDGRLVHYSACQGPHPTRDLLAGIYGLEKEQVRVVVPDVISTA